MSINIKIHDWRESTPEEQARDVPEMHRTGCGYRDGMSLQEIYDANHGYYTLNRRRARAENLATWSHRGVVVLVVLIEHVVEVSDYRDRKKHIIVGKIVTPDDRTFGWKYKDTIRWSRNPVTYEEDNPPQAAADLFAHMRPFTCSCGCGQEVYVPGFAPGHAQKALSQEITAIFGSIEIFLACVRRKKYRTAIEEMVYEMRREHQSSLEELARDAEDYEFEQWSSEL
jgi:hypothetical protein